jgi:hypothetical protein
MVYKILADLTVALHLAWIVFLFLGALGGARRRWVKYFHLSGLGFAVIMQVFDWYCPLTHLEVYLRARHHTATTYSGDFIIQYLERLVYLQVPHYAIVIGTLLLVGLNFFIYFRLWKSAERPKYGHGPTLPSGPSLPVTYLRDRLRTPIRLIFSSFAGPLRVGAVPGLGLGSRALEGEELGETPPGQTEKIQVKVQVIRVMVE